ncbi:MAG: (2Fe-2S)-binding protein [Sphingopyxis sp.]
MTAFTVNDRPVRYRMDPATPLLFALREASNLTGTKYGCGSGDCGACTVDIDGEAVRSCQISIADCEGRFVTTIEHLSLDRSHAVQQAWAVEQVTQCGFCEPGMIMAISALLKRNPNPTDAEIEGAITNLCRCGIYPRVKPAIARAIRIASGAERAAAAPPPGIRPRDAARVVPALTPSGE